MYIKSKVTHTRYRALGKQDVQSRFFSVHNQLILFIVVSYYLFSRDDTHNDRKTKQQVSI